MCCRMGHLLYLRSCAFKYRYILYIHPLLIVISCLVALMGIDCQLCLNQGSN
jgi:hypothetical protein